MRLIPFDPVNERTVHVNPDQVESIRSDGGDNTKMTMSSGDMLTVPHRVDEVLLRLTGHPLGDPDKTSL